MRSSTLQESLLRCATGAPKVLKSRSRGHGSTIRSTDGPTGSGFARARSLQFGKSELYYLIQNAAGKARLKAILSLTYDGVEYVKYR